MAIFDELLKKLEESDRAVIEKYPELKATVDRLETSDTYATAWESWKAANWDPDAKTTKTEAAVRRQMEEQQGRIAQLEAGQGAEMSFDEILQGLNSKGFVTKDQVQEVVKPLVANVVDKDAHQKAMDQLSGGFEYIYTRTVDLPLRHKEEFGENLDLQNVFKYMNENKVQDPRAAYEQMVSSKRQELKAAADTKRDEEHKAELERVRQESIAEGEKAGMQKAALGQNGAGIPTDQGGDTMGHLQRRTLGKEKPDAAIPEGTKLGDGVLAQLGYEKWVKSTTQVQ